MCLIVSLELRQLRQFGPFFVSFQWQDDQQISQLCCAWKMGESWYIGAIMDQVTCFFPLQRGYKFEMSTFSSSAFGGERGDLPPEPRCYHDHDWNPYSPLFCIQIMRAKNATN